MTLIQSNWVVISGGPSSGKSTLISYLESQNYYVYYEIAASILKNNPEARKDPFKFSVDIAKDDVHFMWVSSPPNFIFWDTSWVCHEVYNRFYDRPQHHLYEGLEDIRFKEVFILDQLPIHEFDGIRIEDKKQAAEINLEMELAYTRLGYKIKRIPPISVPERAELILKTVY